MYHIVGEVLSESSYVPGREHPKALNKDIGFLA